MIDSRYLNRLLSICFLFLGLGCSVFATRPVQEMSDTQAAINAAKEVQADTLAPELYRESVEWFSRAKNEYQFKNFSIARDYANKARRYAEQAEFEAVRGGANRQDIGGPDPLANQAPHPNPSSTPYSYPTPTGTPYESYQEKQQQPPTATQNPSPAPNQQATPGASPGSPGAATPPTTNP